MLFFCLILMLFTDLYAVEQRNISIIKRESRNPYIDELEKNLSYHVITHFQDLYRLNRTPPTIEGALTPQLFIQNEKERRKKIEFKQKEKLNIINLFIKFIKSEKGNSPGT
ncbi:MAG: hypothetical protein HEEMFOPI_01759 [Holosporales bacterium]